MIIGNLLFSLFVALGTFTNSLVFGNGFAEAAATYAITGTFAFAAISLMGPVWRQS